MLKANPRPFAESVPLPLRQCCQHRDDEPSRWGTSVEIEVLRDDSDAPAVEVTNGAKCVDRGAAEAVEARDDELVSVACDVEGAGKAGAISAGPASDVG